MADSSTGNDKKKSIRSSSSNSSCIPSIVGTTTATPTVLHNASIQQRNITVNNDGNDERDNKNDNSTNNNDDVTQTQATTTRLIHAKTLAGGGVNVAITSAPHVPSVSATAVLGESTEMPPGSIECRGHDFSSPSFSSKSNSTDLNSMLQSFVTTGFQATNLGLAVERVRDLRAWRLSDVPYGDNDGDDNDERRRDVESVRSKIRARIFLAYTSNQISCGQREVIRFLVQHGMVDVLVTTAGGIEEDIIKCFRPTYMGDFRLSGRELRKQGINRIGNLLVPNRNYCEFEDWVSPIINAMHDEQDREQVLWAKRVAAMDVGDTDFPPKSFLWTPSKVIRRLGVEINNPDSVLYWAARNNIPVFCPALTDGSIGDMLYFHSYKRPGFVLDIHQDIRNINDLAVRSHCTGQIILGGGLAKHHTCNANLMRNGADYSVYINTASEYDGSDSGASPDEAVSWGKIRMSARPVKVTADATIAFPLLVAATFAQEVEKWKGSVQGTVCWADDLPTDKDD
jgi:deoxyhypusine synthase